MQIPRILLLVAVEGALVLGLAIGCSRGEKTAETESQMNERSDVPPQPDSTTNQSGAKRSSSSRPGSAFLGVRSTALGLKLPEGMIPALSSPRLYRFEGLLPPEQLDKKIKEQIQAEMSRAEKREFTYRGARVLSPQGQVGKEDRIGVHIVPRLRSGSILELWLESAPPSSIAGWTKPQQNRPRMIYTQEQLRAANERLEQARVEVLRIMEKEQRGQALTEQEKKSDYFE